MIIDSSFNHFAVGSEGHDRTSGFVSRHGGDFTASDDEIQMIVDLCQCQGLESRKEQRFCILQRCWWFIDILGISRRY